MRFWEEIGKGNEIKAASVLLLTLFVYNKENLERQETDKYGRGTEEHLPKTDESVVRPAGERR